MDRYVRSGAIQATRLSALMHTAEPSRARYYVSLDECSRVMAAFLEKRGSIRAALSALRREARQFAANAGSASYQEVPGRQRKQGKNRAEAGRWQAAQGETGEAKPGQQRGGTGRGDASG